MEVQGQEALSVTIAGSNVAGDVEQGTLLMHYDDLPGVSQRLITESQLNSRAEKLTTIQQAVVSAAGPGYSGSALITAGSDLLMANRDYALLGAITRTPVHQVTIVGPDTGNVKIGIPGISSRSDFGGQFFPMLNRITGKPTIPIISSGNKSSTFIGVSTDENAGTFNVTLMLALLK